MSKPISESKSPIYSTVIGSNCKRAIEGKHVKKLSFKSKPFLSTLQNMGVKSLLGVENFQQGEFLSVQAAYKFLHAAKMNFMQL